MAVSERRTFTLSALMHNRYVFMTGGVIGIVLVMVIPLPPRMIDLLLACNITLSFVTILVALYTSEQVGS